MEVNELKEFLEDKFETSAQNMETKFAMNNQILTEKFTNVELQLEAITTQTTKTNGRVTKLETQMELAEKYNELHVLKCPLKKEFEEYRTKMDNDLFVFTFMRRFPKFSMFVIGILILMLVAGGIENLKVLLGL